MKSLPAALLALVLAVPACGGAAANRNLSYGESAREEYNLALADFDAGNCTEADPIFRRVRRQYSYSRYAALAELRLADCMMKEKHWAEAIQAFRQFVRYRPSHAEVPYARFQIAIAYYRQIPDSFFLSPPAEERDQGPTREALRELRRFLLDFPEDERLEEARRMQRECLAMLARHELYVARFYLERDHPLASVGRLRTLLRAYRGSGLEPDALFLLGRTYLSMRDRLEAQRTFEQLVSSFPESGYATMARDYIDQLGLDAGPAVTEPPIDDAPPVEEPTTFEEEVTSGDQTGATEQSAQQGINGAE